MTEAKAIIVGEVEELERLEEKVSHKKPIESTFKEFLERCPPHETRKIISVLKPKLSGYRYIDLDIPDIQLHCKNNDCQGKRYFDFIGGDKSVSIEATSSHNFLTFACRNCRSTTKDYAIEIRRDSRDALMRKYGELPKFGLPEPTRLTKLIKDPNDLDLFNKGFDCENQGKGIGAFTYYRRMVDSVKDQLIDEIAKAVKIIDSEHEMLKNLEDAKKEKRFKEAIDKIKDTLPKELFIGGANPLTALYSALSGGVHELSDGECQDKAHDIRLVLTELFERTQFIMADKKSISEAVHRLMNPK